MNKIEVQSNTVPHSSHPQCYIFCLLDRGRGSYRGSRGGK